MQSTFSYDTLNRVTALSNAAANYTYTLDGTVGNRTGVTEQLTTQAHPRIVGWNYDSIYRLDNENISADPNTKTGSVGYGLDPVGNRLNQTSTLPGISTGSFTYDPDDRLFTETYDNNGNTLTSEGRTFSYDFENRLKSMNAGAVTIQYDADGNRVAKTVNGVTTRYLVDDLNPTGYAQVVEELGASGVQRTYTYGVERISQNQLTSNAWTPSFYGYDGVDTVRLLTDANGSVTDTYDYDAWGNIVNSSGSTPNTFLYSGEQYDTDLGVYYLRARYYSAVTGRFLSRDPYPGDPADPVTRHKYLYANGDPTDLSDPSGMAAGLGTGLATQVVSITSGRRVQEYPLLLDISAAFAATVTTMAIGKSIVCVWELGGSWLNIANWFDHLSPGDVLLQVVRERCAVTASSQPSPTLSPNPPSPIPSPQPGPAPNPTPHPAPPQQPEPETCDTDPQLAQLPKCLVLAARGFQCSEGAAFAELSASWMEPVVPLNPVPARLSPVVAPWAAVCLPGGSPIHISTQFVPRRKDYPGTIGCCSCCEENPPHKVDTCTIINRAHNPYPGFCGFH